MSQRQARAVAAWQYEPPYDFYDAVADPGDLAELLDPVSARAADFAVLRDMDDLVGFFTCKRKAGNRRGRTGVAA